ncbi:MAG: EamA family transporter, partial [Chloroflexi bacterium]|nr:EamA family transporter [Chloroflexota bacterium]
MRAHRDGLAPAATDRARLKAALAWTAVSFFWGTTYLAIRVGVATLPPAFFAGSRFVIAGVILWLVCRLRGDRNPIGGEWLLLGTVGLLLLVIGNGLVVTAERGVDSGTTALAVAMMPIWMASISAFLPGGERLSYRGVCGLILGIGGLVFLLHPSVHPLAALSPSAHSPSAPRLPAPGQLSGIALLEAACFSWAGGSVLSKRCPIGVTPLMGAAVQMTIAGIILWFIAAGRGEFWRLHFTPQGIEALAYLVVFGSLVGYVCYMYALEHLPATTVSLYAYVNPIVALLAGAVLLREPMGWTRIGAA